MATDAGAKVLDARAVQKWGPLSLVELGMAVARRMRTGLPSLALLPPAHAVAAHFLDEGARLRAAIEAAWGSGEPIEVDFANIRIASASFLEEGIAHIRGGRRREPPLGARSFER